MHRHRFYAAALGAGLAFLLGAAPAAAAVWTRIGPDGGDVRALAAAPSRPTTVYAGLRAGGVFRSTDGGATWTFAGHGLERGSGITAAAVDARLPATVYIAVTTGIHVGLFESTDSGGSWAPVPLPTDPPRPVISALAADPQRSGVLYVALFGGGVRKTSDGGRTWSILTGAPADTVSVLAVDPTNPATLYAGTATAGAFKSTDGGRRWRAIDRGLPSPLPAITGLAIDPRNPQTLFLTLDGKLFKSTDGGARWRESDAGLGTLFAGAVAVDPAAAGVVYVTALPAGVYRSSDGGRTWRPAGAGLPDPRAGVLLATRQGLFAGTLGGVAQSRDRALSWQTGHGLAATSINGLAIDSQDPPRLLALDLTLGLFKSPDRGGFWWRLPIPGGDLPATGPVVVEPSDPQTIDLGFVSYVAQSRDGGRHWSQLFSVGCVYPGAIVLDPSDPAVVYASGGFAIGACGLQPGACDSYKYDHGQVTCLRAPFSQIGVTVLAVDPAAPHHLFGAGGGFTGLFQSFDAGLSWSLLSAAFTPSLLVFDPAHPGTLYAPSFPHGVARSTDGGATWQYLTAGLPADISVISLAIDPADPATLYAATPFAAYVSTDSGESWAPLGSGLEEVVVGGLKVDPVDPTIVYAATFGGGVMRLRR